MSAVIGYLFEFFIRPFMVTAFVWAPLLVFGLCIGWIRNRMEEILLLDFGKPPYYAFAALGTPVHELSHLVASFIFGHKIKRWSLFRPEPGGRLGFVEHAYDPRNVYQVLGCFFIALAPLVGGILALWFLTAFFLPHFSLPEMTVLKHRVVHSTWPEWQAFLLALIRDIRAVLLTFADAVRQTDWKIILYLILATAVGSHMFPSKADFKGALPGFLVFILIFCAFFFVLFQTGFKLKPWFTGLLPGLAFVMGLLIFILLLLVICLAPLFLLSKAAQAVK